MRRRLALGLALFQLSCGDARTVAVAPNCNTGATLRRSADSAVALCIDEAFRTVVSDGRLRFERGLVSSSERVWFVVHADSSLLGDDESWPPSLATRGPCSDCSTADSVRTHLDTLADLVVQSTTGLVSGGFAGLRRQPFL